MKTSEKSYEVQTLSIEEFFIVNWLFLVKIDDLVSRIQHLSDETSKMTRMTLTQLVSTMVYENKLPPVFLNPITDTYEYLPENLYLLLKDKKGADFRKLYTSLKKKAARMERDRVKLESNKDMVQDTVQDQEGQENDLNITFWNRIRGFFQGF
jgi:hypothetical protein